VDIALDVKRFFDNEWPKLKRYNDIDTRMLHTLHASEDEVQRKREVLAWLNEYGVFQGLENNQRERLASNLVDFATKNRSVKKLATAEEITSTFKRLEAALRIEANLVTKTGEQRRIESLTSKALWCCYPSDVPIMDSYAENSLKTIGRMLGLKIKNQDTRYEMYTSLWFQVYAIVVPEIDKLELGDYPYKVRVFDKYLWWLGQSRYEGLVAKG
jgi:hypothetical protein